MAAAADSQTESTGKSKTKSTGREYYEALLIALIFVNFARIFVFQAFKIPSGSMEDNLKIGDHIIVNKFIYGPEAGSLAGLVPLRNVQRGDIIVFRYPEQPEIDFVKRVIGLPGDRVSIENRKVFVNGARLDEPYAVFVDARVYPRSEYLPETQRYRDQMKPYLVPEGRYFVMGDNRDYSHDSRYWGTVPRTMIKGRAFMVYWSFDWQPAAPESTVAARVRELGNVALRFFTNTRWKRTFFIVDSKYHFTPGVTSYGTE